MQEQTVQLEHQSKVKVGVGRVGGASDVILWSADTVYLLKPDVGELNTNQTPPRPQSQQEYEAAVEQLKGEQIHLQGEERRKTLTEETKQNQAVWDQHSTHCTILMVKQM